MNIEEVMNLQQAIIAVLKERFPNLNVAETTSLAAKIMLKMQPYVRTEK